MGRYIVKRLTLSAPTLVALTVLVFIGIRVLIPISAVDLKFAGAEVDDPVALQKAKEDFGITGPLPFQYLRWATGVLRGDFGKSFYTGRPVIQDVKERIPVSLELSLSGLLITVVIALPVGLLAAVKRDSAVDYATRGTAILFYAVPSFWIAVLVLVFGNLWFNFVPSIDYTPLWVDPLANLRQMWLPIILVGLHPIGVMTRLVRTQVLEVVRQDYVRTARAKGVAPRQLYTRHVLRNALLPVITVIGGQLPAAIAGTVIFEQIFVLPGMGQYLLDAVRRLDLFVLLATNLFFGGVIVFANLAVDLTYGIVDPRVRLE